MKQVRKVYSLAQLKKVVVDVKRQGKVIGITHGAFDLFHYAHLDLLIKSSELCDFLVVGIDSDENVRSYKGNKRPIFKEKERAEIIRSIYCVDAVFLYHGKLTPEAYTNLYKTLYVDVVTIGENFGFKGVISKQVKDAGAKLFEILTNQTTTTRIINEIVNKYK